MADKFFGAKTKTKNDEPLITSVWQCPCGYRNHRHLEFCCLCGESCLREIKPKVEKPKQK